MPFDVLAEVTAIQPVAERTFRLVVECPEIAREARPGQFAMIGFNSPLYDPFLRRPMSFSHSEFGRIEFIIKIVGWGTALLADLSPGVFIPIMGPLGNGFQNPIGRAILVAGGTGLAPMSFAAEKWKETTLLYGESCEGSICDLHNYHCEAVVVTEDGSCGETGLVTDYLARELEKAPGTVYACGPIPMMAATAAIADSFGLKCYISLEARMACGVGACAGCAVLTKYGYKRVCADGPVFDANHIEWEALDG